MPQAMMANTSNQRSKEFGIWDLGFWIVIGEKSGISDFRFQIE